MRYAAISFCILAAACSGAAPTAPTSSLNHIAAGAATTEARGGSELPFKGTYEGEETVPDETRPSNHHLEATGTATHLGRFTVKAGWMLGAAGMGTSTWTAANGDSLNTSFTRSRIPPTTFTEVHTILGGDGRFAGASGEFTVVQIRALSILPSGNSATFDGRITLDH